MTTIYRCEVSGEVTKAIDVKDELIIGNCPHVGAKIANNLPKCNLHGNTSCPHKIRHVIGKKRK